MRIYLCIFFFEKIAPPFAEDQTGRNASKVVKMVHMSRDEASLLQQAEEIIFSTSLEKGAFVLSSADGLLMGF